MYIICLGLELYAFLLSKGLNVTFLDFKLRSRKGAKRTIGRYIYMNGERRGQSPYTFFQQ